MKFPSLVVQLAFLAFLALSSSRAYAEVFGWHPSAPLYLGATFDPDSPKEAKAPCLKDIATNTSEVDTGAPSTSFRSSILNAKKELFQIFSVSASFSASYGMSSGGGSVSALNEVNFDSETIVWSLSATSNYGRTALNKVELKDEYAKLSTDVIRAICGTHFIVMDRREAVASAIFTFKSSSRKTRDELKTALSANWSGGSFSAATNSQLTQAMKNSEVSFTFLAKGGDGFSATSGFVTTFDKIDEIRKAVATYISKTTRDKAPAAEYVSARLPLFSDVKLVLDARERTLSSIWYDFLVYDQHLREAKAKLEKLDSYWYLDREVLKAYLVKVAADTNTKIEGLSKAVGECLADKTLCNYKPDLAAETPDWPSMEIIYRNGSNGCVDGADSCSGDVQFLLRIRGPGRPASIQRERLNVTFPGTDLTTTCLAEINKSPAEGQEYNCLMGHNRTTMKLENVDVVVSDLQSGAVSLRVKFSDAFPDHWYYTRPERMK